MMTTDLCVWASKKNSMTFKNTGKNTAKNYLK